MMPGVRRVSRIGSQPMLSLLLVPLGLVAGVFAERVASDRSFEAIVAETRSHTLCRRGYGNSLPGDGAAGGDGLGTSLLSVVRCGDRDADPAPTSTRSSFRIGFSSPAR